MLFTGDRIVRGHSTHLHAYKHIETRKYLHLDKEGRAFVYLWPEEDIDKDEPDSYREVDPQHILREVLRRRGE
jgi:hypothetical protein